MTTAAELDDRYGRTRTSPRRRIGWIVAGIAAVAAAVAVTFWFGFANNRYTVSADVVGFNADSAQLVTVDFQFTADPGSSVTCALSAQDTAHGIVGYKVVRYDDVASHTTRVAEHIRIVDEATTGTVEGCWIS